MRSTRGTKATWSPRTSRGTKAHQPLLQAIWLAKRLSSNWGNWPKKNWERSFPWKSFIIKSYAKGKFLWSTWKNTSQGSLNVRKILQVQDAKKYCHKTSLAANRDYTLHNPLGPKSGQHVISPYNFDTIVIRIKNHQLRKLSDATPNSHSKHFKKIMAKVMENPFLDLKTLRAQRLIISIVGFKTDL